MKNLFLFSLLIVTALFNSVMAQWKPAGDKIKTSWAESVDPQNVLPEYPRPIMERSSWKNLNGLWDYAITPINAELPQSFDGEILVPFAVESSLSGVQKTVGANNILWYHRNFEVPKTWKNKEVILHFGAVDWKTEIWVNDIKVGEHIGGYAPFSFNVTPFVKAGVSQKLVVKVFDPTDKGPQARGKQVANPNGIWYTPVTGIWQTVWLEPVAKQHITRIKTTPNIDNNTVVVEAKVDGAAYGDVIEVTVSDNGKFIKKSLAAYGEPVVIGLDSPKLWSPDTPHLYDMQVAVVRGGKTLDKVKSYFAMRKISMARDQSGIVRMQLNNKNCFQYGPLDQGWWPDGLYTAPTDEALKYDIQKTKDFGFNMIRKHVKVEPARWYTHCDKIGILVWQDMPNGDAEPDWQMRNYYTGIELERTKESEEYYRNEWKEIMDYLYSYPSIVVWVPFNERWGQFKTVEIVEWTKEYDPSRLVNPSSGGNHFPVGDILDLHNYPGPELYFYDPQRVTVLGEYGGIGLALDDHLWAKDKNWGYVQFKSSDEVTEQYIIYAQHLKQLIKTGFSAAVYTQTTDVEGEVNGLMTYDRKVIKIDEKRIRNINQELINSLK
ncbi:MAG: beta-galactosidase [Labilibaculum sp.]|nr:beta-galactosidase [Labilibaculum sp.]